MFEYYEVRFTFTPPLYNSVTVDMLFNIVGHKIDGNYDSRKYMGHKTARDRLALGRGPYFGAVQIMHIIIVYIFHIFIPNLLTLFVRIASVRIHVRNVPLADASGPVCVCARLKFGWEGEWVNYC